MPFLKRVTIYSGSGLYVVFGSGDEFAALGCHRAMWFRIGCCAVGLVGRRPIGIERSTGRVAPSLVLVREIREKWSYCTCMFDAVQWCHDLVF